MKFNLDFIDVFIHKIAKNFTFILFVCILVGMFFVNSIYLYIDMPDFQRANVWNYLGIFINLLVVVFLVFVNQFIKVKFPKAKFVTVGLLFLYFIAEFVYLKLVPIKPFSDMLNVTSIAFSGFRDGMEYLQSAPNNLPISIIFYLLFKIYNDVFIIKLVHVFCNIVTIYFSYRIYFNIFKKDSKFVLLLGVFSISVFLYANYMYNDVIFTVLTTVILYFVTKPVYSKFDIGALAVLLFLQFIIRPVGIILYIAVCMFFVLKRHHYTGVAVFICCFVLFNLLYSQLENNLIPESEENLELPVWSYIQMGFNEEEFGFQNSSHSADWGFDDVVNRFKELGFGRLVKLLGKKHLWLWTEGTYQVERYVFGDGSDGLFFYETPITKRVANPEDSAIRSGLEYLMKGQYFVLILLCLVDFCVKDEASQNDEKDLFYYLIVGLFCFYTVWEIKSRYIYCLYPVFLVLGSGGLEKLVNICRLKLSEYRKKC